MNIDEEQSITDISDNNIITVTMKINKANVNFRKSKITIREYMKTDEKSLQKFSAEMKKQLPKKQIKRFEELNQMMKEAADKTLKAVYKRRVLDMERIKEPPWITEEIREEIKKRKELNRKRRRMKKQPESETLYEEYKLQKQKVKLLVKKAITESEKKITYEIRTSRNKSKTMWENIDKLRKKERKDTETHLYSETGTQLSASEEKPELVNYWKGVYQQHTNERAKEWSDEAQETYIRELEQVQAQMDRTRCEADHIDMVLHIENTIEPMENPDIDSNSVKQLLKGLKTRTAPGPDGLRNELYKQLANIPEGTDAIKACIKGELSSSNKPETWKRSLTKLIPKNSKPTAKQLRPIALTDSSYKIYMSVIRNKIEEHLRVNKEIMEIQAGFTDKGRVEDNLFLLQYCVEQSYRKKKPLFVTAIDYAKAFDSVRRNKVIDIMKKYKVHPEVISSVVAIYGEDSTIIKLNNDNEQSIDITSGIRQGCTGSTTLFKLVTYEIAKELMSTRMGYNDRNIYLPLLLFADDGLVLSQSEKETEMMIKVLTQASEKCGLRINKHWRESTAF